MQFRCCLKLKVGKENLVKEEVKGIGKIILVIVERLKCVYVCMCVGF